MHRAYLDPNLKQLKGNEIIYHISKQLFEQKMGEQLNSV